jgi:hypothetical protein
MIIIGLCGYSKAGKDYVADQLVTNWYRHDPESSICKEALATPLKRMAAKLLGKTLEWIEEKKDKRPFYRFWPMSIRQFLIFLSEKVVKPLMPNPWARILWEDLQSDHTDIVIVTDIRYKCEYDFFKDKGMYFVKINRPGHELNKKCGFELEYEGFDCKFNNGIDDCNDLIRRIIESGKSAKMD